jgi:adenosylcobinamide kinase/adenosylcobinamide-phosphate guanylyltransferase
MKSLILGGVKSGKSRFSEQQAICWAAQVGHSDESIIYLATAENRKNDEAFSSRIARHIAQRPTTWKTVEEPLEISDVIGAASGKDQCVLLECLTLWVSNLFQDEATLASRVEQFCEVLEAYEGEIILVSNETGLGIMPPNALARRYGDELGLLHQRLASICDEVVLIVAGLPHYLKQPDRL